MSSTTLVIPCYNEERRLDGPAFLRFAAANASVRLLLVNDGSRDQTLGLLRRLADERPIQISVLDLAQNSGKAEAVRQGMLQALSEGADYAGYFDADLATPLEASIEFTRVLDRLRGIDVVVGSRLQLLGRAINRRRKRAFLGRVFARAASMTLGIAIHDTQCGAKLFRATPWVAAAFDQPFCTRWIFDVEVLARIAQSTEAAGGPSLTECVYEFPLDDWREVAGSKLKATDFLKAPAELAQIYWRYLGPFRSEATPVVEMPRVVLSLAREDARPAEQDAARRAA
ncbi:Poly-beta-1,6-N-acetyl-D-glucosamine synthase [Caulifigura coniformis]|uniref:Poly-beta-1,6-N-acetyl-D-glucosamine synthase n=1 Tax=Caulifigura coniformis TaxID=2527983 RepID=A0A517SGA0_9PLAN|nr:glycosyltransferase [Caulifigura coniformis]QDT55154.1 Poly-beta-1,6-N-acetyl-D-glucosamine synthase [Caulifigura coniformis]